MIKLSKLLEKLYNNEYLTDKEYEVYIKLVSDLKAKESKNATTDHSNQK